MKRAACAAGLAGLALVLQGCGLFGGGLFGGGLFGGGTPPCESPQEYLAAEAANPMVAPEGLETPQAFGNLEVPEGEILEGQARRDNGSCLEEPPRIEQPGAR